MSYLFVLSSKEFVTVLPLRFQTVGKYVLLLHIPMVLVFNLLGSFTTLTYREHAYTGLFTCHTTLTLTLVILEFISAPQPPQPHHVDHEQGTSLGVKFTDRNLHVFFSSLALLLLITYQALNFCVCFYRLVQALVDQRRIDNTAHGNDNERHFFNGIGWIALGIKLGAIESIVGFASGDFGLILTRRILRFLGRACLIIGIVKGSVTH